MSRRKKRVAISDTPSPEPPEKWPAPKPRRWVIVLSAACVLAWMYFLLYVALWYQG